MTMTAFRRSLGTALACAVLAGGVVAQPSAYFLWKHKTNGKTMCEPDADPKQWTQVSGPYEDVHCKQLAPK
jgi:hypothetical protein